MPPLGNTTMFPRIRSPPDCSFGLHMPLKQKQEEITEVASVINPSYREEIGLLLDNGV